jgi:hypothetical protein
MTGLCKAHVRAELLTGTGGTTPSLVLPSVLAPLPPARTFSLARPSVCTAFGTGDTAPRLAKATRGAALEFTFQTLPAITGSMASAHRWGALQRLQTLTQTPQIGMVWALLPLCFNPTARFYPT